MLGAVILVAAMTSPDARDAFHAAPECSPDSEAVRAVRAVAAGIIEADNARDIDRVLGFYAEDAVLMPPGESPVTGREAIRPRYEDLFARFDPRIEPRLDEVCADGRLAFVRGRNGGRLIGRGGGETRELDDAYLMLLRREAGGAWRISHLIWHPARKAP
jgi:uncharacterized protein (TIGR02246 family)